MFSVQNESAKKNGRLASGNKKMDRDENKRNGYINHKSLAIKKFGELEEIMTSNL